MTPKLLTDAKQLFPYALGKKLLFFLDYDGTLTPIADRPGSAVLSRKHRKNLLELSKRFPVAIISGRDRKDVEALASLEGIVYAGSHGFDIKGAGVAFEHPLGAPFAKEMSVVSAGLKRHLQGVKGAIVEEKKFAVAAHYRLVDEKDLPKFLASFDRVCQEFPFLRKKEGKKVVELLPQVDWDKGKALLWLLDKLGYRQDLYLPIFIGDDLTDEDAFFALKEIGVGICVTQAAKESFASFYLRSCDDLYSFFSSVLKTF